MTRLPDAWQPVAAHEQYSVWATGQKGRSAQLRDGGYLPETENDSRGVPPAIAAYAIARYSLPAAVVADPDCGAGVVVVEALRAGRHAVGMTKSPRWWRVARANVTAAKHRGAWHDGTILDTGAEVRPFGDPGHAESADLVVTAIRLPTVVDSPGPDSDCLAGLRAAASLLRPGGYAVVVLRTHRAPDGTHLDLPGLVSRVGEAGGLISVDRCIAVTGQLRGNRIVARASTVEREAVDRARAAGMPIGLAMYRTVLIFRAPSTNSDSSDQ
jgi:modification methylase